MAIIRKYIEAGKPLVGIRTACHAFDTRGKAPAGHAEWKSFDPDVLGGHYTGHHANDAHPEIALAPGNKTHEIIRDIETPFVSQGSLYKVSPLAAGTQATADGNDTRANRRAGRLGQHPRAMRGSFTHRWATAMISRIASFRKMLRNAVLWALDRPAAVESRRQERQRQKPRRGTAAETIPLLIKTRARVACRRGPGIVQGSGRSPARAGFGRADRSPAGFDLVRRTGAALGGSIPAVSRIRPA